MGGGEAGVIRRLRSAWPDWRRYDWMALATVAGVVLLSAWLARRASIRYLLMPLALGGLVVLLRYPGLGLVALAGLSFTLPFTLGTGGEVSLSPPVVLIPLVAGVWLIDGFRRRALQLPSSRVLLPLVLFLGSGLLSLLAGRVYWNPMVPQPGNLLLVQMGQWAIFALSALIFVLVGDLGRHGRWLQMATWVFLAAAGVVVVEMLLPERLRLLGWSVPQMGNRSMLWVWLSALATGQLAFNQGLARPVKWGLAALLLAGGFVLWVGQSSWASGWAPYTIVFVIVIWLRLWRTNRVGALAAAVLLAMAVLLFFPGVFQRMGGDRELEVSWGGRQTLYKATLDLIKDHPILGLGPAAYRHYGHTTWLGGDPRGPLWLRPNISSHNNYIDVYAQTGLVGLALFLWFLVELGLLGWRLAPGVEGGFYQGYAYGTLGGFVGTVAAMMLADWFLPFVYNIGFGGFRTSALAWMFLGGLLALEQRERSSRSGGREGR